MRLLITYSSVLLLLLITSNVQAIVLVDGDVTPSDSSAWAAGVTVAIGGDTGNGTVTVNGSSTATAINSEYCLIGGAEGTSGIEGTLSLSGSGAEWTTTMGLVTGYYGIGLMNITNGATMSVVGVEEEYPGSTYVGYADTASGTVNVSGTGSSLTTEWLNIGVLGSGALSIGSGGTVTCNNDTHFGTVAGSEGTVEVSGSGSSLVLNGGLNVGFAGTGTLSVADGAVASLTDCSVGYESNSDGTVLISDGGIINSSGWVVIASEASTNSSVTISGSESQWNVGVEVQVGRKGTGELNLVNGGKMNTTGEIRLGNYEGAHGAVTVSGVGSELTIPGYTRLAHNGAGELTITGGGVVNSGSTVWIGRYTTASGTATISGSGSLWTVTNNLTVADSGAGELYVTNGGSVTSGGVFVVGSQADGIGVTEVSGNGSTLTVASSDYSDIGCYGTGTLNVSEGVVSFVNSNIGRYAGSSGTVLISDGGIVNNSQNVVIASATGSNGNVTVSDSGSQWNVSYEMQVGRQGTGELSIIDGGKVDIGRNIKVGDQTGASGTITISGEGSELSVVNTDRWLRIGNAGDGTMTITNGGLAKLLELRIGEGGFVNMSTGGMLALPGDGSYSLNTFLGGIGTNYDHLQWWNETLDDWQPMFGNIPETEYTLTYYTEGDLYDYTVLTVGTYVPEEYIPGDANKDGKVDGSDVTILANHWQEGVGDPDPTTITWEMGDFNGDGQVDGSDVTILANHWQEGVAAVAATVPEPSTIALLIAAAMVLLGVACQKKER